MFHFWRQQQWSWSNDLFFYMFYIAILAVAIVLHRMTFENSKQWLVSKSLNWAVMVNFNALYLCVVTFWVPHNVINNSIINFGLWEAYSPSSCFHAFRRSSKFENRWTWIKVFNFAKIRFHMSANFMTLEFCIEKWQLFLQGMNQFCRETTEVSVNI